MIRKSFAIVLVSTVLAAAPILCNALGHQQTKPIALEGYSGSVVILPNAERKEITIALTMGYVAEGKSSQIVFHIQKEGRELPENWEGAAHVLAGNGILAVIPDDGKGGMLFRFSEVERPTSLDKLPLSEYSVYGIARYGEVKPLNSEEIDTLARTGRP